MSDDSMTPLSPDGLSPPAYCRCHRFIFHPFITEPPYLQLMPTTSTSPTEYEVQERSPMDRHYSHIKAMTDSTNITLWQFLLELLVGNNHTDIIQWTNNEGEFKLLNPEEVATLWGKRKNKTTMNYDKLSRALRYYYEKNIIKKVLGQKFMYKFVSFPEIVKTETKIPFRQKMETMAQEYGQQVFPHFASYNAASIKSSAETATCNKVIKSEVIEEDSMETNFPAKKIRTENIPPTISISPVPTSSIHNHPFTLSSSSAIPTTVIFTSAEKSHNIRALNISQNNSSSATSTSKPKPNPLTLNVTAPAVQTTITAATPLPVPSPKRFHPPFSSIGTPFLLASPMICGPRTPLTFWSSLSPIATLSPRLMQQQGSSTAFQFPISVNGQLSLPNFSAIESMNSTSVSSPTRSTIPVL